MKRCFGILVLILAAVLLLSACGGRNAETVTQPVQEQAAAAEPTGMPAAQQRELLEENRDSWAFTEPYESPWFYTFTDLDHNGRLEVIAASTQGTGVFTYAHFWEVKPDFSGIDNCYHKNVEIEGPDDWPEIVLESLPCYYDSETDSYWYPCEGITREGAAHQYHAWYALCLKDGVAEWEQIASKEMDWIDGGDLHVSCTDAKGDAITEQDYDMAVDRRFGRMERSEQELNWLKVEIPFETSDTPPAPEGSGIIITKHPTGESVPVGGRTWFIAHADNADSISWVAVSPEGETCTLEETVSRNPGLTLEVLELDTLGVRDIPLSLSGWSFRAVFTGPRGSVMTNPATITVSDWERAYEAVFQTYRDFLSRRYGESPGTDMTERGDYILRYQTQDVSLPSRGESSLAYCLRDLDGDNVPELLIGAPSSEYYSDLIFDLFTLVNGIPTRLAVSSERLTYRLLNDGGILYRGSGGAAYTNYFLYRLEGGELLFLDGYVTSDGTYYEVTAWREDSFTQRESDVKLSEDQFWEAVDRCESQVTVPDYIPF